MSGLKKKGSAPLLLIHQTLMTYDIIGDIHGCSQTLKAGSSFKDKDGNTRHHIRIRWWDQLVEYGCHEPPCFLGHYWMEGTPVPLAPNIACVDFSVAKAGGKLVAYRWDGEAVLSKDKFVWVDRCEDV